MPLRLPLKALHNSECELSWLLAIFITVYLPPISAWRWWTEEMISPVKASMAMANPAPVCFLARQRLGCLWADSAVGLAGANLLDGGHLNLGGPAMIPHMSRDCISLEQLLSQCSE